MLAVVSDKIQKADGSEPQGEERFMLLIEVARDARASISSVRHWLRTGRLQSVRPGRRRLVRRQDFERFMAELGSDLDPARRTR
jgi:excisionase family DNA binding protein